MSDLLVRVYNVLQGDAILVTVPDRDDSGEETTRHILIDVGNLWPGEEGSDDTVYGPVLADIEQALDGKRLDLYVMTHEHYDHVEGLRYAKDHLGINLRADHAWLTRSAATDYYTAFPNCYEKAKKAGAALDEVSAFLAALPPEELPEARALLALNAADPEPYVSHLRKIAPKAKTHYVHRGYDLSGAHPFREACFEILAPEEDCSVYYGPVSSLALGVAASAGPCGGAEAAEVVPPHGVEAGAFHHLIEQRRDGYVDALLAIDAAKNNTSLVFSLHWRGWRLLFTGDAELKSWAMMDKQGLLKPVHFLKVGHHGSANATPRQELLGKILPHDWDGTYRGAAVSAYRAAYGHPHKDTMKKLEDPGLGLDLRLTEPEAPGSHLEFVFPGQ